MDRRLRMRALILCSLGFLCLGADSNAAQEATKREVAAPTVWFQETAVLSGSFPYREPWSPSGSILIYNGGDPHGLWAFDPANPDEGSRLLIDKDVQYISWSPDGTWLVGSYRSGPRGGEKHLIAFPVAGDGDREVELPASRNRCHFMWGSDGGIYYWTRGPEPVRIEPPAAWRDHELGALPNHDHFVLVPRPKEPSYRPGRWPCAFMEIGGELRVVPILVPFHGTSHFSVKDAFPDGKRMLAWITVRDRGPLDFVVDLEGVVLATFDQKGEMLEDGWRHTGFSPHSVSSDSRFLAGYRTVEDGHDVRSCAVYMADVEGSWVVPIEGAPQATRPHLSRVGWWLAGASCSAGQIHVGELEITSR